MNFRSVGYFSNETEKEMTLILEVTCEEVILSPGHEIELLAEDKEECFPMHILYHLEGIQIYPHKGSPEWLIKFRGKEITPEYPTKLSSYE